MARKVDCLESLVSQLREENVISSSVEEILGQTFSGCTKELLARVIDKEGKSKAFPDELKCFALTLHFYSPKVEQQHYLFMFSFYFIL